MVVVSEVISSARWQLLPPIAVAELLSADIVNLATVLLGSGPTSRTAKECRFRNRGSLAVVVAGPKRGQWFDYEAGYGGDALGLIAHLRQCPMREAYRWALHWLGLKGTTKHQRRANHLRASLTWRRPSIDPCQDSVKRWSRPLGNQLYSEALPPAGTVVESYLASRRLALSPDAPLRFHPKAWRNSKFGPHGPAMIACMTVPETGERCGAHVTYLRADGRDKSPGERPRIMLGDAGVVRLVPDEEVTLGLGLAEGVETALSVMQGFHWSPVWAATSAGAIGNFPVLPGIITLTIFADPGDAGEGAAHDCAVRWRAAGREAQIIRAPENTDFNDLVRQQVSP
jgi:putative DNA primase/helicase